MAQREVTSDVPRTAFFPLCNLRAMPWSDRLAKFVIKLTKECIVMKSISRLRLSALLLGGVGLCAGTGLALSPAVNSGNETQKAPLQIREDDNPLVRDVKDGTSFAPIVQKV